MCVYVCTVQETSGDFWNLPAIYHTYRIKVLELIGFKERCWALRGQCVKSSEALDCGAISDERLYKIISRHHTPAINKRVFYKSLGLVLVRECRGHLWEPWVWSSIMTSVWISCYDGKRCHWFIVFSLDVGLRAANLHRNLTGKLAGSPHRRCVWRWLMMSLIRFVFTNYS